MRKPDWKKFLSGKGKKPVLAATAGILAVTVVAGIVLGTRGGGEPVPVYSFQYMGMTEFWGDTQESYGPVTTDKIQTVFLSETQSVTEILVKVGDTVKKGDKLLSFDTTLDGLTLERKRLETEKLKLQLQEVQEELKDLHNKPVGEEPPDYIPPETEPDLGAELTKAYQLSTNSKFDGSTPETALICWIQDTTQIDNTLLDAIWLKAMEFQSKNAEKQPSSASALPEGETVPLTEPETPPTTIPETVPVTVPETAPATVPETVPLTEPETVPPTEPETVPPTEPETVPPTEPETVPPTEPETVPPTEPETVPPTEPETVPPTEPETVPPTDPETVPPTEPETTPPTVPEETQPDAAERECYVVIKVTEENKALGARVSWQGMHLVKKAVGGYAFSFFDAYALEDHTTVPEEPEVEETWPEVDIVITYTPSELAQMRTELNKQIKELDFKLKMAEAEYKIMVRELGDGNIYADIDGEVVSLLTEEEAKEARQPVIKVSGGGGFFVEGSVSELEKDNLKPGQEVTINDWNTGMTYTGEVRSIGDFPTNEDGWNGMGNPNASYYPFQVFVDDSADLEAGRYVSVTYSTSASENGIYLENPFLRTEDGRSYVYLRGVDGKLEKRYVTAGKSLWGSYTQILSGISETDWLAFPYGKNLKPGAPTVESDISDLYSY